jgi:hypothetical protein
MKCTACSGDGWYCTGDWAQGYPKGKCVVCKGSGDISVSYKPSISVPKSTKGQGSV